MSIQHTIEHIYKHYENRDFEGLMSLLPDGFCFEWPADKKSSRYAGRYSTKKALLSQLEDLANNFEFNAYKATNILIDGNKAAAQVQLNLTSKKNHQTFDATLAHFWVFENQTPMQVTEYIDSALLTYHSEGKART